jgi:hypothetical protein
MSKLKFLISGRSNEPSYPTYRTKYGTFFSINIFCKSKEVILCAKRKLSYYDQIGSDCLCYQIKSEFLFKDIIERLTANNFTIQHVSKWSDYFEDCFLILVS